jgi:hypothetical protein
MWIIDIFMHRWHTTFRVSFLRVDFFTLILLFTIRYCIVFNHSTLCGYALLIFRLILHTFDRSYASMSRQAWLILIDKKRSFHGYYPSCSKCNSLSSKNKWTHGVASIISFCIALFKDSSNGDSFSFRYYQFLTRNWFVSKRSSSHRMIDLKQIII